MASEMNALLKQVCSQLVLDLVGLLMMLPDTSRTLMTGVLHLMSLWKV